MILRLVKLVVVLTFGMILASCARLPSIQLDQLGPEVTSNDKNDSLYYSPSGPSDGASQQQIIDGFLYAGNGPQDDYSIARQFLTVNFSSEWQPASETLIQTGQTSVISNTGTKIRVQVNFDAKVTADGTYVSSPGSSRILEFRLIQELGEWRITSAPNLTTLLRPNFSVLFKSIPVYFWDRSFAYLVPDVRWFPTRASLATKLTNALIQGPNSWLSPAVQNVLPEGTKLNINSVTVDAGTASIDFNSAVLKIPNWKRPYLRSQLLATLGGVEGITKVAISVERTLQSINLGSSGMPDSSSNLPVVLTKDGLSHIAGTSLFDIRGTKALVEKQNATSFALSSDESIVVLVGNGMVYSYNLGLLGNQRQLIDSRPKLITPTIDQFKNIWTTTQALGSPIRITDTSGTQLSIPNPYGYKTSIRAIAMSPEGSRLAIIHGKNRQSVVDVVAIIRDKNRKVLGLGPIYPMTDFGADVQSISWVDNTTLSGLVTDSQGVQSTLDVELGGISNLGHRTQSATSTVTTLGGSQYYISSSRVLFVSSNLGWDRLRSGVKALRMAGQ